MTFSSVLDFIDDHLGAIVVKEARQAVRSRFVVTVQFLFLAVLVVTLGWVLLNQSSDAFDRELGREVFMTFQGMLYGVCVLLVPLYAGMRLSGERNAANVDLLFSTTLRPWSVVMGKLASGLMVGVLAASACAPFMVLCYFLRGVDVATMAAAIVMDLLALVVAVQVALFIAVLPVGGVIKAIAALGYLVFALASFNLNAILIGLGRWGGGTMLLSARNPAIGVFITVTMAAAVFGLLFLLTTAILSPPSANRALPVRAYLSGVWLFSAVVALTLNIGLNIPTFKAWAVGWSVLLAVATLVGGSERAAMGPRLKAQLSKEWGIRGKLNAGAFMLYSGSAGGLFWAACMAFMTLLFSLASTYVLDFMFHRPPTAGAEVRDMVLRLAVANGMVLGYVLVAGCLNRRLFGAAARQGHTGAMALGLMLLGVLVPLLGSFMMKGTRDFSGVCVAFPFTPLIEMNDGELRHSGDFMMSACLAIILMVVGLAFALPWLLEQAQAFQVGKEIKDDQSKDTHHV